MLEVGITNYTYDLLGNLTSVTDAVGKTEQMTYGGAGLLYLKGRQCLTYDYDKMEWLLKELRTLDLLILDEWGYVPIDKDGSQLLFRVISDSCESKSLILMTNLEFSKWGGIFTDDQMAAAMIDRLVYHGHLPIFECRRYRMEHALMRQDA